MTIKSKEREDVCGGISYDAIDAGELILTLLGGISFEDGTNVKTWEVSSGSGVVSTGKIIAFSTEYSGIAEATLKVNGYDDETDFVSIVLFLDEEQDDTGEVNLIINGLEEWVEEYPGLIMHYSSFTTSIEMTYNASADGKLILEVSNGLQLLDENGNLCRGNKQEWSIEACTEDEFLMGGSIRAISYSESDRDKSATLTLEINGKVVASDIVKITVLRPLDLVVDGMKENVEENPGLFMEIGDTAPVVINYFVEKDSVIRISLPIGLTYTENNTPNYWVVNAGSGTIYVGNVEAISTMTLQPITATLYDDLGFVNYTEIDIANITVINEFDENNDDDIEINIIKITHKPSNDPAEVEFANPAGGKSVSIYAQVDYNDKYEVNAVNLKINGSEGSVFNGYLSKTFTLLDTVENGDTIHHEIYSVNWDSSTFSPMVYNEMHSFCAYLTYTNTETEEVVIIPSDVKTNMITNLVIEQVTPTTFIVVEAGSNNNSIDFDVSLNDYEEDFEYNYILTLRRTESNESVIAMLEGSFIGLTHQIIFDMGYYDAIPDWGAYLTFDLDISKADGEKDSYRSKKLQTVADEVDFLKDTYGNIEDPLQVTFKYSLNENPLDSSVDVFYYNDTSYLDEETGLSAQSMWDPPLIKDVDLGESNSVRCIISAKDNHATDYRNKKEKQMLDCNDGNATSQYRHYILFTFDLNGAVDDGTLTTDLSGSPKSSFVFEWRKIVEDNKAKTVKKDWYVVNYYQANSSGIFPMSLTFNNDKVGGYDVVYSNKSNQMMNNKDYEWVKDGPIPISNPVENTVLENTGSLNYYKLTNQRQGGLYVPQNMTLTKDDSSKWANVFCTESGTPISIGGSYYTQRFVIHNQKNGDTHNTIIADGRKRSELRLHEDGNYYKFIKEDVTIYDPILGSVTVPFKIATDENGKRYNGLIGSAGCIGLRPGGLRPLYTRLRNNIFSNLCINNGKFDKETEKWIPLLVFGDEYWVENDNIVSNTRLQNFYAHYFNQTDSDAPYWLKNESAQPSTLP